MPEIRFKIQWPDGSPEVCYSPSLIVKQYFVAGENYALSDFVVKARESLTIASDRVTQKFGFPCSLALGQIRKIEQTAQLYQDLDQPLVKVESFVE